MAPFIFLNVYIQREQDIKQADSYATVTWSQNLQIYSLFVTNPTEQRFFYDPIALAAVGIWTRSKAAKLQNETTALYAFSGTVI